jgi:hypothetical protein
MCSTTRRGKDGTPERVTSWFPRDRIAIIVQALVSCAMDYINETAVVTWRWVFIIFGRVVLFTFMPDSLLTAKFLDDEKMIAIE